MSDRLRWPAMIAASALTVDLLALGSIHGPVRLLVTLWFLLICTGMSFVPLFAFPSVATSLLVAVLLSIVLDTLAATAIVEVGGLSATSGLIVLQTVCVVGCALQMFPWPRRQGSRW